MEGGGVEVKVREGRKSGRCNAIPLEMLCANVD